MNFKTEEKDTFTAVTAKVEKLNASNAPELKSILTEINKKSVNNIIIDLTATKYCDSSGLTAILMAHRLCKNASGKFVLTGLQANVSKMVSIAQLDRVLNITQNRSEAEKEMMLNT